MLKSCSQQFDRYANVEPCNKTHVIQHATVLNCCPSFPLDTRTECPSMSFYSHHHVMGMKGKGEMRIAEYLSWVPLWSQALSLVRFTILRFLSPLQPLRTG